MTPKNNLQANEADEIINNLLNDGDMMKQQKMNSPDKIFKIDRNQNIKKEPTQQPENLPEHYHGDDRLQSLDQNQNNSKQVSRA